jgi:hypothetical protein
MRTAYTHELARARMAAGEAIAHLRGVLREAPRDQRVTDMHAQALDLFAGLHALESQADERANQ